MKGLPPRVTKKRVRRGKLAPSLVLICWKFCALDSLAKLRPIRLAKMRPIRRHARSDWLAKLRLTGWQFRAGKLG